MREKKTLLRIEWSLFVNLESPSPTDALCQVWLKLAHPLWRWRFFNFLNVFLLFHYYLHFEKGFALYSPFTHGGFLPSLIKNVTDRQTDGWKAHFRIQLRWAKKPWQNFKNHWENFIDLTLAQSIIRWREFKFWKVRVHFFLKGLKDHFQKLHKILLYPSINCCGKKGWRTYYMYVKCIYVSASDSMAWYTYTVNVLSNRNWYFTGTCSQKLSICWMERKNAWNCWMEKKNAWKHIIFRLLFWLMLSNDIYMYLFYKI